MGAIGTMIIGGFALLVGIGMMLFLATVTLGLLSICGYFEPQYRTTRGYRGETNYHFESAIDGMGFFGEVLVYALCALIVICFLLYIAGAITVSVIL